MLLIVYESVRVLHSEPLIVSSQSVAVERAQCASKLFVWSNSVNVVHLPTRQTPGEEMPKWVM